MLTPYLVHLKSHCEFYEPYAKSSEQKDKSSWNLLRNTQVSGRQIKSAYAIAEFFKNLDEAASVDSTLHDDLEDLVYNQFRGQNTAFSYEVKTLEKRIEVAYQWYDKLGLLNQKAFDTPVIIFKTAIANYFIRKEMYQFELQIGYYTYTGWAKSLTHDQKLSLKKDQLLTPYISEDYSTATSVNMLEKINSILKSDQDLLEQHGREGEIPIPNGFFHMGIPFTFRYSRKTLTEEMEQARLLISNRFSNDHPANQPLTAQRQQQSSRGFLPCNLW